MHHGDDALDWTWASNQWLEQRSSSSDRMTNKLWHVDGGGDWPCTGNTGNDGAGVPAAWGTNWYYLVGLGAFWTKIKSWLSSLEIWFSNNIFWVVKLQNFQIFQILYLYFEIKIANKFPYLEMQLVTKQRWTVNLQQNEPLQGCRRTTVP